MEPQDAEVSTLRDGDETTGILIRFADKAVTLDTTDDAFEYVERVELALEDEDVDDPTAEAFIADIRERAEAWEAEA